MERAPVRVIPQVAAYAAQKFQSRTAIQEEELSLSFEELDQMRLKAARGFLAAGIQPQDRVAVWAPNIHEWVVAALGLMTVGGVLVPLNTRFKGQEAAFILNKARARVLLTVEGFLDFSYCDLLKEEALPHLETVVLLRGARENCLQWEIFLENGKDVSLEDTKLLPDPADLSDIIFTSGTTGAPKGVMTTHAQNLDVVWGWCERIGLVKTDRYLVVNPFFHAFGYKAGWLACLLRGATILPHLVFDAKTVLARIEKDKISTLPGPPTLYQSFLADPELDRYTLSSLRLAATGAAAIPTQMIRDMHTRLGFKTVVTGYGLTEAAGFVSMCCAGDDPEIIATTSGCPLPGVEVRIADDDGNALAPGKTGEIWVRGENVMKGYFEEEETTAQTVTRDGWLKTGDLGTSDKNGYLRITGRKKDIFIAGGFNCSPEEIENMIFSHPHVAQVAVIGIPDERLGEVAHAFVVRVSGATLDAKTLIEWCRERMANYKVPRKISFRDTLPMTASGKVQKFRLR